MAEQTETPKPAPVTTADGPLCVKTCPYHYAELERGEICMYGEAPVLCETFCPYAVRALQAGNKRLARAVEEAYAEGWDAGLGAGHDGCVPQGCYRPDWVTSASKEGLRRSTVAAQSGKDSAE